tara:strand:+ start:3415 stop:3705 length:291 start_codon:yes stop_codon:yes gene_type:complete
MSYHDSHIKPRTQSFKNDNSKKNYYDELDFWITRAKNLKTLLIEASEHIEDFERLMKGINEMGIEGDLVDDEHLTNLQKFLRVLSEELGDSQEFDK